MNNFELLLYFVNDTDLRLECVDNEYEFLELLKLRFANVCPERNLKVFGVPNDSLREYRALNTARGSDVLAFENEPPDMYRLRDEEVLT